MTLSVSEVMKFTDIDRDVQNLSLKKTSNQNRFVSKIAERLYIGSRFFEEDFLHKIYINAIVNVAAEVNDPYLCDENIILVKMGLLEDSPMKLYSMAAGVVDFLHKEGKTILVHCFSGMNRSPLVVAHFLMKRRNITLDEAYSFVMSKHPLSNPKSF